MSRGCLELSFLAQSEGMSSLRRRVRLHLGQWGLAEVADEVQLCVSELVANVITHVGEHTPTALRLTANDTHVRIEVSDPDVRALPTLLAPSEEAESGRGMALLDAVADRWGVILRGDTKVTWCELAAQVCAPRRCACGLGGDAVGEMGLGLGAVAAEEAAVEAITGLLRWLRLNGYDLNEVLKRVRGHA
ncbi:ATP-binding protein [Streptomyces sp. NPDC050703]|uniref:ATP-binding protein n=1 Tax=Streptomyces sp. NPDC050703 TaxID=3157218 RepID=UPI003443BDCC